MATAAVAEEVAQNLEEIAQVTRRLDTRSVGFLVGGLVVGVAVGFYIGHRWKKEKARAEAFEESQKEVEQIREVYQQKAIVAEPKPELEEVIEQRGYVVPTEQERPLKAPVPITGPPPVTIVNVPPAPPVSAPPPEQPVITYEGGKDKDRDWNYPQELQQRSPDHPYVIHQDEFESNEVGYNQVAYTYYAEDDVLSDTDDHPLPHADIVVGQDNLKWGHGSDDIDVVYVRNDKLQLDMEITRSPASFEKEVLGLGDGAS